MLFCKQNTRRTVSYTHLDVYKRQRTVNPIIKRYGYQLSGLEIRELHKLLVAFLFDEQIHYVSFKISAYEKKKFHKFEVIVEKLLEELLEDENRNIREMLQIILTVWLSGKIQLKSKVNALILMHGERSASSVAWLTNEMIGSYVYEAFDMPDVYKRQLSYRMQWETDFLAYLKGLEQKKPVIFAGDLNVAYAEIDLKNPKTNRKNAGFTDEERAKFGEVLKAGFIDTFRYFYPDMEGIYSWWSYRFSARAKNAGWRIDYFCVSESLKDRLADAKILTDVMGSDHCPIELDLKSVSYTHLPCTVMV